MIRTLLSLKVEPDRVDDVLRMYRAEDILRFSLEHSDALASEISVAADGSGDIMITALWPDAVAYDRWLNHPYRQESAPRLANLLKNAQVGAGRVFSIHHAVSKASSGEVSAP